MARSRTSLAVLGALLLLLPAGGAMAQTPEPIERTPEMEQHAAELAAVFPTTLGDVSIADELQVNVGQELIGELDPSDPDDAADIAEIEGLMAAAGATLDDAATAVSFFELDEGSYGFIAAYQIRGSDAAATLPQFVAAFEADIADPLIEQGQIADTDVTFIRSGEDPEGEAVILVPRGDITWLLALPDDLLEEAIGSLPAADA